MCPAGLRVPLPDINHCLHKVVVQSSKRMIVFLKQDFAQDSEVWSSLQLTLHSSSGFYSLYVSVCLGSLFLCLRPTHTLIFSLKCVCYSSFPLKELCGHY